MKVLCSGGGCQVGGVGGHHDEGEEVPGASYEPGGQSLGGHLAAHPHDGRPGPPQRVVDVEALGGFIIRLEVTRVCHLPFNRRKPWIGKKKWELATEKSFSIYLIEFVCPPRNYK